jgi:response regulator RpfG family c-di-GMP phosphodiesterase
MGSDAPPRDLAKGQRLIRWSPALGLLGAGLAGAPLLLSGQPSAGRIALHAASALLLGLGLGIGAWKAGRLIQKCRRRAVLLAQSARDITTLSTFPLASPDPMLKVDAEANLLYLNPAGREVMEQLGLSPEDIQPWLGSDGTSWISQALASDRPLEPREVEISGRSFRLDISRFPHERSVLIACTDITRLKELETRLREANERLEQNIMVKSFDLLLTQDVTIMSLVSLAETRDAETGAHIRRTREYVRLLARRLRSHPDFRDFLDSDETIQLLYRSAPLHDIGKVGLPDSILLDKGKLDPDTYDRMKIHTRLGGDALRWAQERLGSNSFLQIARDIAYHHHEKWDASGYPDGLAGEEIPIAARLMALADVYDALTSRRRYKPAYSHDEAREKILDQRGKHFDPRVVDAFLELQEPFQDVARRYQDEKESGRYLGLADQASAQQAQAPTAKR